MTEWAVIVVTGGAGFIGERVVRRLHQQDQFVRSLDVRHESPDGKHARQVDLLDLEKLKAAVKDASVIVHLAGPVVETVRRTPYQSIDLQVRGTLNVLEAARLTDVKRVVLASSFYVYSGLPSDAVANEQTTIDPLAVDTFGASKLMSERLMKQWGDAYGMSWAALRFGSAYGWGRCSNIVQSIIEAGLAQESFPIWGKGKRRNQYTWVEDIVDGILLTVKQEAEGVFNLITPDVTTTGQLAELFRAEYGYDVMFDTDRDDPPSMCFMASHRAMEELGWKPSPLSVGLKATYDEAMVSRQSVGVPMHGS